MAKLTRVTGKVFAGSAPLDEIGQFGSALSGTPVNTQDVATIQSLSAYTNGWGSAVVSSRNFPPIEEVNGVLKTISYQNCYLLQEGIPEYDINTEYSNTSVVKSINNGITTLYVSLANSNIGNALTDTTKWKPYVLDQIQRNIGEIVTSTIPLVGSGLHLLDGSLLQYGSYKAFIDYIATLYTDDPTANYFCTEAEWQQAVLNYGVCDKFVYDSANHTVRLPKFGNQIWSNTALSTAPVKGNGDTLGLISKYNGSDYTMGLVAATGSAALVGYTDSYGSDYGSVPAGTAGATGYTVGLTTDDAKSGVVADLSNLTTSLNCYYYIVIATSTKTDIQVDIDEIATDLNGKADVDLSNCTKPHIVEVSPKNILPRWYRIYSNGWCEQGGHFSINATATETPYAIALSYNFVDANYTANVNIVADGTTLNAYYDDMINIYDKSQSTLYAGISILSNNPVVKGIDWRAEGYIS